MECNNEQKAMALCKISGKKKFFLKMFIVSLVLFIISAVIVMGGREFCGEIAHKYYKLETESYIPILATLMGLWKILIIQFTLVPFIALCMLEKCLKSHMKKEANV